MIRFSCPGCKKVLNAPDDKAGVRLPCPGCKQVVQVPVTSIVAAAATPPSVPAPDVAAKPASGPATPASGAEPAPAEPVMPLGQRILSESGAVAMATLLQTVRPISYVFSL